MTDEARATSGNVRTGRPLDLAWAWLPVLLPVVVVLLSRMSAIDLAYHIRAGDTILRTGSLPRNDTYTFTVPGAAWTDQQWGSQVVLAFVHRFGGWATLSAFRAALVAATFALVYRACRIKGAGPRAASLLCLGGFLVAVPGLALRPQLLALPLVAATLVLLAQRHQHPRRLWWIPLFALVTANLHGSFTLFPALVGLAWLDDLLTHRTSARSTFIVGVMSTVATLVNPFGFGVWIYAYELSTNPIIRNTITEWAPVSLATIPGWFMLGSSIALLIYLGRRGRPVDWASLATIVLFLLLALSAQRAIVWWGVVMPSVVAGLLGPQTARAPSGAARESRIAPLVVIGSLAVLIVALLPWWRGSAASAQLRAAPSGLARAVERLPAGSRLFVHQPWGSWFEYAVPDDPVFVDSRIEIYPKAVWDDYGQVAFAGARWRQVLDRWRPDAIVAEDATWKLIPLLERDPSWRVAYRDDEGVLFVRA
jgi:hypothetical protein